MKKQFVNSSTAEALGYDGKAKILRVWFTTGNVYDYAGVSKTKFKNLLNASSIGEYFNKKIKGFYNYKKVE
ncbi:MAG: KTSC domain-containing protein [Ginsengibacter sp.]